MIIKLKFLIQDVDRHGNVRSYVRRPGKPKIRVRGYPGSEDFMRAYHAALVEVDEDNSSNTRKYQRTIKGSFGHLCLAYYASADFKALDAATCSWRRRALDLIAEKHGNKPVALLGSKQVRRMRDELANKPAAANERLKALRALFKWARRNEEVDIDPVRDVELLNYSSEGHHSWTVEEVEQFETKHPIGSKARLAMTLLLHTAGRREDAVRLGSQHIHDGRLRYTQAKNERRNPVRLDIPVHTELSKIIAATPSGHLTFLVNEWGKPFHPGSLSRLFRQWCDEAGLPHCSSHGLRKATATRLAEAGASAHEIMAVTGHRSLKEVERYTRAARQAALADSALARLKK